MATTATPWIGSFGATDKLYLQSGQFTSTIKWSNAVGGVEALGNGIEWDGVNTVWCGNADDKLYLQSGEFTTTLKKSQSTIAQTTYISGVSFDGTDTPWSASITQKLYLTSNQFTSTIKESRSVGSAADDISTDGVDNFWASSDAAKLIRQSGFTTTIHDSVDVSSFDTEPVGISWDGTNTPWSGKADIKLYLQSGKFTSTLIKSEPLTGINYPESISTNDYDSRVSDLNQSVVDTLTLSDQVGLIISRVPRAIYALNDALTFSEDAGYYTGVAHQTDNIEFVETITIFNSHIRLADVLIFTEELRLSEISELTVLDVLVFEETIIDLSNHLRLSDSILFEEHADLRGDHYDIVRHIVEELEFTETIDPQGNAFGIQRSDEIVFVEAVTLLYPFNESPSDELVFVETIGFEHPYNIEVTDYFNWTYTPDGHPFTERPSFFESVGLQIIATRRGNESLEFVESINVVKEIVGAVSKSVSDTLTFSESADRVYGGVSTLTFVESAVVEVCHAGKDTLTFVESLTYSQQASYSLSDTLILESTVAYNLISTDTLCEYRPFIGTTTDANAPAPPRLIPESIVTYDNVSLFYPPDSPSSTLSLRGPELDNRDQLTFSRISRETRGGTLIIFADDIWPRHQRLLLSFIGLSEAEAQAALTFVEVSLGLQIGLRDWEGKEWSGIILTPDNPITRNHNCNLGFDIEFEGVRVDRQTPVDAVVFTDQVTNERLITKSSTDTLTFMDIVESGYDTFWVGNADNKLYLQSGHYTSTLKNSQSTSTWDITPLGISWDGVDIPWAGDTSDKLFLQSGPFTSTLKRSENINAVDTSISGISFDRVDTFWSGRGDDKLYRQSGQFTSTIRDSESIGSIDSAPVGISWDGTNTPWIGNQADKLYLQSGKFNSTLKFSQGVVSTVPTGISWDSVNTPWCDAVTAKLYLQSGQFTSTLKISESVSGLDANPWGIEAGNFPFRVS